MYANDQSTRVEVLLYLGCAPVGILFVIVPSDESFVQLILFSFELRIVNTMCVFAGIGFAVVHFVRRSMVEDVFKAVCANHVLRDGRFEGEFAECGGRTFVLF